jgi:hypothetical protein
MGAAPEPADRMGQQRRLITTSSLTADVNVSYQYVAWPARA